MYNGPTIDRPFKKDYPNGYQADKAGNLTHDIDGRPLVPGGRTVGRRRYGESEGSLSSADVNAIGEEGTGRAISRAPQSRLGSELGHTAYEEQTKRPTRVVISDALEPENFDKVLGHEVGHVIDQYIVIPANAGTQVFYSSK